MREDFNKAYIGNNQYNTQREPDLVLEVTGTDMFPIWYNNEPGGPIGKRLDLYPDVNGMCEVYFPEEVTSLWAWLDPDCCTNYVDELGIYKGGYNNPYFSRVKKIFGMNKFLETHNLRCFQEFNSEQKKCEYSGDFENWDLSNVTISANINNFKNQPDPFYLNKEYIDLRGWKFPKLDEIVVGWLPKLKVLDISTWDTKHLRLVKFNSNPNLEKIITGDKWSTENCIYMSSMFSKCDKLVEAPVLNCIKLNEFNVSKDLLCLQGIFSSCGALKTAKFINTNNCPIFWRLFDSCLELEYVSDIDMKSGELIGPFYNCPKLKKFTIKNLGYSDYRDVSGTGMFKWDVSENTIKLAGIPNWGAGSEENRQTVVDSLLTYSFDRAKAGRPVLNILLNNSVLKRLTNDEIAAITAKGYNLIGQ